MKDGDKQAAASIDTPKFMALLGALLQADRERVASGYTGGQDEYAEAKAALIAHVDAHSTHLRQEDAVTNALHAQTLRDRAEFLEAQVNVLRGAYNEARQAQAAPVAMSDKQIIEVARRYAPGGDRHIFALPYSHICSFARALLAAPAVASAEHVRKAARWDFMMRVADNDQGPEAQALERFGNDLIEEGRPESEQMNELMDRAIESLRTPASNSGTSEQGGAA